MRAPRPALAVLSVMFGACGGEAPAPETWRFDLPRGVRPPVVPGDNPMTREKVALGRRLFFDLRLSGNGKQACSSCHHPERGFSEPREVSVGSTGEAHFRNAPGLANVAYASTLTWANHLLTSIERHAPVPLFGEHPVEMGVLGREAEVLGRLEADPIYRRGFSDAFPDEPEPVALDNVVRALSSFQRTLLSFGSPFDRFAAGDADALSPAAKRGLELFRSNRLACSRCHAGLFFSQAFVSDERALTERPFHNTGLYDVDGRGGYPRQNPGLYELTGRPEDMGKFRVPSLRNAAVTAPYMHDGSVASLSEVIDVYARGGRRVPSGPNAGDGEDSPLKSRLVSGFTLSAEEKADLLAFLESLTDPSFLSDPRHQNPWLQPGSE